jgi:hypothetical protein
VVYPRPENGNSLPTPAGGARGSFRLRWTRVHNSEGWPSRTRRIGLLIHQRGCRFGKTSEEGGEKEEEEEENYF